MRLWTLHPKYLDAPGLVALWREALLAQKVLQGCTRGYRHHPQLDRFRMQSDPLAAIAAYLQAVHAEALRRGYRFDNSKIIPALEAAMMTVTDGQLLYEWSHLRHKLQSRSPAVFTRLAGVLHPQAHPLFHVISGPIAPWERL